jgi:hypothetical protein
MRKNTGTRTVTTTNFVEGRTRTESATVVWSPEHVADADRTITGYADDHRANALDDDYTFEFGQGEVFEYDMPGLKVVALLTGGTLMTVFTVEDDIAARLHTAVRKARPVTVTYTKADGTTTVRTIEPTGLRTTRAGDTIVKAADRDSGEMRTFRLDRISAYTVHRTAFIVRMDTPAPAKADLVQAFRTQPVRPGRDVFAQVPRRVRSAEGFTGRTSPSTLVFGPSGWSVKILLDDGFTGRTPTGTVRASLDDLVLL